MNEILPPEGARSRKDELVWPPLDMTEISSDIRREASVEIQRVATQLDPNVAYHLYGKALYGDDPEFYC